MTRLIDRFLDHITMYRLVLYYLIALIVTAFVLGYFGIIAHDPTSIVFSTALILAVCFVANRVFARVFAVPANAESVYITALILALILDPVKATDLRGIGVLVFASVWAMASKFIFVIGRKHIFNPAAFGVILPAFLLDQPATWWVGGNIALLPVVLIGGVLLTRKLQRFDLVVTFILVEIATIIATTDPSGVGMALSESLLHSPLFFFAFVMLTEPLTAPTGRWQRLAFGALVGFLFSPNIHIGTFYLTPELALVAGNLFAYAVGPRGRLVLTLERIEQAASDAYDFVFSTDRKFAFEAGQYLEWTLDMPRSDNRGNRRYFTLASAPTEDQVRLGVKFYPKASAFKRALGAMEPGDTIHAAQVAGSFTLPSSRKKKLVFVAGGIGITPFRSMLQYLIDNGEARPITVLYGNERSEDIAYRDVLDAARRRLGIETYYAVARDAERGQYPGYIDARLIRHAVPDYRERTFYISGPQPMVVALRKVLRSMGVRRSRIKVDFFPGFA